jgi:hypothetical protein
MKKLLEQVKKWLADAKAGKDIPEADLTAAIVLNVEDVTAFLETEEGKKLILPRIDQGVTKGIDSFKKNNLEKLVEERFNALHPPETEEQKRVRKLEEDLGKEKGERVRSELKNRLISEATKKGLPVDLLDHLIGADEEVSLKNLATYEQVFTAKLNEAVTTRLAAGGRLPANGGGGAPPKTFTREQMKDPDFVNANWPDIQAAMAAGTIK